MRATGEGFGGQVCAETSAPRVQALATKSGFAFDADGKPAGGVDSQLHRLEENLGAAAVELTTGDLREIDAAAARIEVRGARYSEGSPRMIDR